MARELQGFKAHLMDGLEGRGMAGGSSSAAAQSSAVRKNGDEGAPARNRRREVME